MYLLHRFIAPHQYQTIFIYKYYIYIYIYMIYKYLNIVFYDFHFLKCQFSYV